MFLDVLKVVENINSILQIIIMILIFSVGILLTIRNRFLQVSHFGFSFKQTIGKTIKETVSSEKKKEKTKVSPFAAFATAVAGTVGTGNIVGVATAIIAGGPGAIFWMWFSAFFGMVTNYSENALGIYFRKRDANGEYKGGSMYYILRGLGKGFKWLAILFSLFAVFASIGYNFAQSNSISTTLAEAFNAPFDDWIIKLIVGVVLAIIVGFVIIGGIKRISNVASLLVPFMALLYIILAFVIIFMNITELPNAFAQIFTNAFSFRSVGGGILGYTIIKACRYGVARGIFSNEAGLGSSVIAHSQADVHEPVDQGLWGVFEVFLDTFIICTLTALIILVSGVDISGETLKGSEIGLFIFNSSFGGFGTVIYSIILPLFAFTTIVSWSYYGEKAFEFLFGSKFKIIYKIAFIGLLILGATMSVDLVWELADTFNILMAIPNLIALTLLSGLIAQITKNYFMRKKGMNVKPMLSFDEVENKTMFVEALEKEGKSIEEAELIYENEIKNAE